MMKPSQACLTPEMLDQLSRDPSAAAGLQSVEEHLDVCPRCRALLDEAESDPFWRRIAPVLQSSPELRAGGAIDSEHGGDHSLDVALRLLGPTDDPRMLGRIGSYEVVGVVGRGGMGVVFKAFDGALNRYVAIKMLSPNLAESGAARRRFAREGRAAAAVIDDYVLPIYGVAEWQGVPYLVMQYSRGSTLQKRVEDQGPLDLKEILRIGMQAARGLAAAHASGLVHRDVKPSNILIDGTVERALLTDFGLARAVDDASITRSGTIAGTPQYMSPEQARGEGVEARSDLFSLGGVLYFMSTGRPPFRADNSYAVLRLIADQEPRNMREINPDLPAWLCTLVSHLMAKEPGNRPASAEEVAEVLRRCLAHVQQPASIPLPDAAYWSMKESPSGRRHRSSWTRWAFVSPVALVAFGFFARYGVPRHFGLQTEESRANAAADAVAQQPPDVSGLWVARIGNGERFSIRRPAESSRALEIHPLNGPPERKWVVEWMPDRRQFVGTAVLPGDIEGKLTLSTASGSDDAALDVALTFDELQKRRLLKRLSEDGVDAPSAEVRMIELLDQLLHQTWLRHESEIYSRTGPAAGTRTEATASGPHERVSEESAFRGFDSGSVAKGAGDTWRKYVQWWNSTRGMPLPPSAEIPRLAWATLIVQLMPQYIYTHGANVVIVRSRDGDGEEGIYVALGIASGPGPDDAQFTRTLIAHAAEGDVSTFRRRGRFEANLLAPETRKAMVAGLDYLASSQGTDGSWPTGDQRGKVAVTALAGRALLAAGCRPGQGPDGARLAKAIEYVLRHEAGGLLAEGSSAPMYEHGFAVRFLAEAYGKVADGDLKDRLKATLTRAVGVIADGQNREGGWRYQPNAKDADMRVTCCQLQALAAARVAGIDVSRATVDKGVEYIFACRVKDGRFRYMPNVPSDDAASYTYTAAALSALNAVGVKGDEEVMDKGVEFLRGFKSPGVSDALLYNVTLYEAHDSAASVVKAGITDWNSWYSGVRDALLDGRNKEGVWGDKEGSSPILTALALLILHSAE
ncbi:MAG: hypothetical protein BGO49_00015 [Planctomycetales bacterium 71-10]|nr:MAG: hypothetical protein BGO49_00015 [Planctomycetales bacterium 71-10]